STARCAACREARRCGELRGNIDPAEKPGTLCFQCYRAELDRERALTAAASLNAASEERFQLQLPLEPGNRPRLAMLRAAREAARQAAASRPQVRQGLVIRRRRAQLEARHTLDRLAAGLRARGIGTMKPPMRAAELRRATVSEYPAAWVPFLT